MCADVATEFHEAEVREAFLRFHVSIFQKYRDFFSKKPEGDALFVIFLYADRILA